MKPLVVFISIGDWANSTYEAVQAINRTGQIDARHITLWKHPLDYPTDLLMDVSGKDRKFSEEPHYDEAMDLLAQADLIHLWNCEFADMYNQGIHGRHLQFPIKIPIHKVKTCTWAGTLYRHRHAEINERLSAMGIHICVEDPCFHWPKEQTEFIPHAVDTDKLVPVPYPERDAMAIGCYNPGRDYYDRDLALLQSAITASANGCHLVMNRAPITWDQHLTELQQCWFYFQTMDEHLGTFGRSALEASSMGIPTFSYVSDRAKAEKLIRGSMRGGLSPDDIGIIEVTPQTLPDQLRAAAHGDLGPYQELAQKARRWVVKHYSYPVVGQMYTDMLKERI